MNAPFELDGRRVTITRRDDLPLVENEYSGVFTYDTFGNPKLEELRAMCALDQVVEAGVDEFDRQVRLMDWVFGRFRRFGKPTCEARGALNILEAIDGGHAFFCSQYAEVLVSAAASLGWIVRILALRRVNPAPGSTEHSTTEIWSNQHRKWVMLDPTYALYVERDGVPLNAYELRQEWFINGGRDLVFAFGADRNRYTAKDMPVFCRHFEEHGDIELTENTLNKYAYIGYVPNTNLLDAPKHYADMFITKDEICEGVGWHVRKNPRDPAGEPYFPLGQTALDVTPSDGLAVQIDLQTLTPNFDTFEVQIDSGEWDRSGDRLAWPLHEGTNILNARTLNQFGVEGPVSTLELFVEPSRI